jgi:hypothetical protein
MGIQKGAVEKIDPSATQKRINALIASCDTSHSYVRSFGHLTFDLLLAAAFFGHRSIKHTSVNVHTFPFTATFKGRFGPDYG